MAQTSVKLYARKWGLTRSYQPNTVQTITDPQDIDLDEGEERLYFGFDSFPSSVSGRSKLLSVQACFSVRDQSSGGRPMLLYPSQADFNPATLTWGNMPSRSDSCEIRLPAGWSWADSTGQPETSTDSVKSRLAKAYVSTCAGFATPWDSVSIRETLTDGVSLPYVEIFYDPADSITSKIELQSGPTDGFVLNPGLGVIIRWRYVKNSDYYCINETWTQSSAKLYWRVSGASSWNQISISGSGLSYTVPSNTFPSGKTIQWYLQGTDTEGTTTTTSTFSFVTASGTITPDSFPSGSNLDTRTAVTFTWHFASDVGDIPQSSAKLFWKKSTAGSWNQISVTGRTQSLTVPANTFPTGSTIQWYLQGTDAGGTTTSSEQKEFKTVSTQIKALGYPSGSNVYPGSAIGFQWYFNSSVGNYSQSSAKLYWKKDTENIYQSISVSGDTQQLSVPANTFPTNSTIQWYLEGTDSGGLTTQTGQSSFKTLQSKITIQSSPSSGYTDPRYDITFRWYFSTAGGAVPQGSASLFWKVSTDESYTEIEASGSTENVTAEANTFPVASVIDWYLSGTDYSGAASQTEVYHFSTEAGTATATCSFPVGAAMDGSKEITFEWLLTTTDGSDPIKVEIGWRPTTSTEWETTVITGAAHGKTFTAGTFPSGEIEWRVRAMNRDSVWGSYSYAAFVCLRAPDAPAGLSATAVPLTTVSWQSGGQQAYEITVDGSVVRKAFGPDVYSWMVETPLDDGIHEILVRVQGSYGLWSDYAATTISVINDAPAELTLSGSFDVDAELEADSETEWNSAEVHWFRDGVYIAKTRGSNAGKPFRFKDRLVLGEHEYAAEIWLASGNYIRSNTVKGSMMSCITRIAPLSGGEWLSIELDEKSDSQQSFQWKQTAETLHVTGSAYPVLELSPFEDLGASYSCAVKTVEDGKKIEALRGQTVIIKSRGGNVITGAMTNLTKTTKDFYITYAFSLTQIRREELITIDEED